MTAPQKPWQCPCPATIMIDKAPKELPFERGVISWAILLVFGPPRNEVPLPVLGGGG